MLDACMSTRHVTAFGSSLTLHLLAAAVALWLASAASRRPTHMGHTANVIAVFVPAQTEDSEFPGLNPIIRTEDDVAVQRGDESSALSIGSFAFDFAKIADRARVLFPFVTPGLSLQHFSLAPPRELSDRL